MRLPIAALMSLSLVACGDKESDSNDTAPPEDTAALEDSAEDNSPLPSEIILSNSSLTLTHLGETMAFTATVLDQFGDPIHTALASWTVSDESVVKVDADGTVTAIANGQATLTASVDALQAEADITVLQVADVITVSPTEILFSTFGDSQALTATVIDAGGSPMTPTVVWESADTAVVTVDATGLATAIGNGSTEITAHVDALSASVSAEVNAATFTLHSNGLTVLCPDAALGEAGQLNGVVYTKRNRAELEALIQSSDWAAVSATCTSGIEDMGSLFYNVYEPIGALSSWDLSSVTNAQNLFYNAGFFNEDIGHWNVSSVTNMKGIFNGAFLFNHDIGDWDVSKVTNFNHAFESASAFNQNIGNWDVSSATNTAAMFFDANAFNQDISGWDVSNVTEMNSMFYDAIDFNQDLSGWCVSNIGSEPINFVSDFSNWTLPKPAWGTCPN